MSDPQSSAIGVDLGGTKVLAALVSADGDATHHAKAQTPVDGPESVADAIAQVIESVRKSAGLDALPAVGIGVPGPVHDGVMLEAPNLVGFDSHIPMAALLRDVLDADVVIGNDASVGTLGEARHGAGAGATDVLGCWLGTGIGGGLVLDGRMRTGPHGAAAELGHLPVVLQDGRRCGCGRHGCVEAYAGRTNLEDMVAEAVAAGESTALLAIRDDKGKDRLTSGVWKKALKKDDPLAVRLIDQAVEALSVALAGAINLLDVQMVIFGGGLAEKLGQDFADRIAEATRPRLMGPQVTRTWTVASLGDDAGVIGSAALALEAAAWRQPPAPSADVPA